MDEVFPVLAGIVVGLATLAYPIWLRGCLVAVWRWRSARSRAG